MIELNWGAMLAMTSINGIYYYKALGVLIPLEEPFSFVKTWIMLATFIDSQASQHSEMPCVHTTDGYAFRALLEKRELTPQRCPLYLEDLIYLFYGRPAYRPNMLTPANRLRAYLPVCLIFSTDTIKTCKRVHPFDTGAFAGGLFKDHVHEKMNLSNFEITPSLDSARRLVATFFGSNRDYLNGKGRPEVTIPELEFEADAYHHLVLDSSIQDYDDRNTAVELQIGEVISLNVDTVEGVILPKTFMGQPEVSDIVVNNWCAEPLTYDYTRMKPVEYTNTIYTLATEYYERKGYL